MKNLFVKKSIDFDVTEKVVGYCVDVDNESLFVISENFQVSKMDTKNPQAVMENININLELKDIHRGIISRGQIRLVEYIVESGSILVALRDGHILKMGVTSYSLPSQYIYEHNCAISSIKISPDQDLIALADDNNDVSILYTNEMSVFKQQNALTQDRSLHKPVGVGWGSKETQFFGLDGRPSKEKQTNQLVNLTDEETKAIELIETSDIFNKLRAEQDLQTIVDWRGDGQLLATLTFLPEEQKHYLKVWNRNLELQYMSEKLVTVERGLLSWVPNGKYVCCAQRRDNVFNEIAMFEKNGMVHERLALPTITKNIYIKELSWSNDSKVLAIIVNQFSVTADNQVNYKPILMLYTTQNFHYYLKFSCYLTENCTHDLRWDPICPNRLRVVSSNGHYSEYDCNLEVSHSDEWSTVVVVDTNKLLLTPMELCTVPPPMCSITMELDSLIYKVAVDQHDASNIFILTIDGSVICKDPTASAGDISSPVKISPIIKTAEPLLNKLKNYRSYKLQNGLLDAIQDIVCLGVGYFIGTRLTSEGCDIFRFTFSGHETILETLTNIRANRINSIALSTDTEDNTISVILSDCLCFDIDLGSPQELTNQVCELHPSIAQNRLSYISSQSFSNELGKTVLVSLSNDLTLRVNEFTIASNTCTSFRVTSNYIIYTTTDHQMHFVLLSKLESKGNLREIIANMESWSQPIENGGTLVVVCEAKSRVVLQMPRGNLEVLHPRVLVISALTSLLDSKDYIEAIKLARHHRVNMNYICDYLLLEEFFELEDKASALNEFASCVAQHDPSLLNIFITELDNEDTITNRYKKLINHIPPRSKHRFIENPLRPEDDAPSKLSHVFNHIKLPEEYRYIQPRILCYLKREPRDIQSALMIIHNLNREEKEEALKFILYFVDVDQLFVEAIKSYNTDVALMVASASNKDPKEYLVLLDNFNQIKDVHRRHLEMDLHVKDYEAALRNLLALIVSSTDDCDALQSQFLDLVQSKRLYTYALDVLYKESSPLTLLGTVWSSYGSYLLEKRYFIEAGLAFSKSLTLTPRSKEVLKQSLTCFSLASAYDMSIVTLARAQVDDAIRQQFKEGILKELVDIKRTVLYLAYLSEKKIPESDLEKLIDSGNFLIMEAFASDENKQQALNSIKKRLDELSEETVQEFTLKLRRARDHFARLKKLLVEHQDKKYNQSREGNYITDTLSTIADSELSSNLSSGSGQDPRSGNTRSGAPSLKTRVSAKSNKQGVKKRRIVLKQGGRYEDLALIAELKKFISEQDANQTQGSEMIALSFVYDDYAKARLFSTTIKKLLEDMMKVATSVYETLWPINSLVEQKYSLYRRFRDTISIAEDSYDDQDFLPLIRPSIVGDLQVFSL